MNDFQIISKLGEGAYSTVFKVKRIVDNQIYALKKVKLLKMISILEHFIFSMIMDDAQN